MDQSLGEQEGQGPCLKRLREFSPVLDLCFGAYGEGSPGVHILASPMAALRVKTLTLQGKDVRSNQLGLEISTIRRRLSIVVVRANHTLLLGKIGQVGEGNTMAGRRRAATRAEQRRMELEQDAGWLCHASGRQLVQWGQFWRG